MDAMSLDVVTVAIISSWSFTGVESIFLTVDEEKLFGKWVFQISQKTLLSQGIVADYLKRVLCLIVGPPNCLSVLIMLCTMKFVIKLKDETSLPTQGSLRRISKREICFV